MKPAQGRGFTLVEMVVVIAIAGIIAAMTAVFIRRPVDAYVDAARRGELTDTADIALRRMGRDLRAALPNSTRVLVSGTSTYVEFLLTSGGGRYRSDYDSSGGGDPLNFEAADTSFDVIGTPPTVAAGDRIVIYNLGPGSVESDAYTGGNSATVNSAASTPITIDAKQFPFASPGRRFHVVRHAVTYRCNTDTGELRRYWGYAIDAAQFVEGDPRFAGADNALLARDVSACSIVFNTSPVSQRTGVVSMRLELSRSGDRVALFHQVHTVNAP